MERCFTYTVTAFLISISCYLEDIYDLDIFQMDLHIYDNQRFSNGVECIFKLTGLLSTLSALMVEVTIASCQCWRVWEFNDKIVSIGLWEAYYSQHVNISGCVIKKLVHTPFNSTWTISPELQYAETLIVWAILMKPVALVFSVMAIKISCMKKPVIVLEILCYKVSALILCVSSLFTFVSVTWNHIVDLYGHTTFDFPSDFPVKKEALVRKQFTVALPLGLLTATMSLFGVMIFLSEINALKLKNQAENKCDSEAANQEA